MFYQVRRMAWISAGVGWSGRDGLNLAVIRMRRSLPVMSAVDSRALLVYQGGAGAGRLRRQIVPGGGVPGDGDALAGELEGDGAAEGAGGAVAGLPGAEDLLGSFYRGLDGPSACAPVR